MDEYKTLKKRDVISENDLFLTLGLGTSNARNENLRPLLNTNIPLISGNYGLRNHFWPLESRFLMRKNEKKSIFSFGPNGPILQNFLVVQYLVGSLKIPSDGSNNLIFLDQVKRHCVKSRWFERIGFFSIRRNERK